MSPYATDAQEEDSDDEMDWEEVVTHVPPPPEIPAINENYEESTPGLELNFNLDELDSTLEPPSDLMGSKNIEITLVKAPTVKSNEKRKKQANEIARLRALRLICHKLHTVSLLSNALTRNKWINDPLLHARLLSMVPLTLQASFTSITKKNYPEVAKRGRVFETSMMRLTQWWSEEFFKVEPYGHIRSRTFDQVQKLLPDFNYDDDDSEVIRNSKSLMKHVLNRRGSKDISAQLFTALCRALKIPTRLVVSLQSVPWNASAGKSKSPSKAKRGENPKLQSDADDSLENDKEDDSDDEDDDMEEVEVPLAGDVKGKGKMSSTSTEQTTSGSRTPTTPTGKGKEKALPKRVINLRKSKPKGQRLDSNSSQQTSSSMKVGQYPVFWTEVFSRPDGRWIPVDPVRYIVNKRKVFEPPPNNPDNRMVYVIAVEEDGYCRDVTPRYARDYGTKTSKIQLGGRGRNFWWESIMTYVTRPYRLLRDDAEDEEFEYNKFTEGMPTSVAGFKNHALYILEQHLKREEIIHPRVEIGKFKGEPVYPRSNVVVLKTAENWMRLGRQIKEDAQALKWVKQRAVTVHRRRAMELAQQEGEETLQGLYSEEQTELYMPEPVVDGVVPKNDFGNIDLYVSTMLPKGASHIPHKGIAKIAKKLGFDYAEAVTSFEFKKGRAFPVITGIVIASENEETLLEAYWEAEKDAVQKEETKRKERVIKRWVKLIHGLRIRQRLRAQYTSGGVDELLTQPEMSLKDTHLESEVPGGFLTEINSVVQPFQLPRYEHVIQDSQETPEKEQNLVSKDEADVDPQGSLISPEYMGADDDETNKEINDFEDLSPEISTRAKQPVGNGVPKSLLELAEVRAAQRVLDSSVDDDGDRGEQFDMEEHTYGHNGTVKRPSRGEMAPRAAAKPRLRMKGSESSHAIPRVRTPARGRRRNNKIDEDEDLTTTNVSDVSSFNNYDDDSDGDAVDMDSVNGGDSNIDSGRKGKKSRSQRLDSSGPKLKRKRSGAARAGATAISTMPSPSTRVLRTRTPKSAEKLQAEKEAEAAFRKAVAQ